MDFETYAQGLIGPHVTVVPGGPGVEYGNGAVVIQSDSQGMVLSCAAQVLFNPDVSDYDDPDPVVNYAAHHVIVSRSEMMMDDAFPDCGPMMESSTPLVDHPGVEWVSQAGKWWFDPEVRDRAVSMLGSQVVEDIVSIMSSIPHEIDSIDDMDGQIRMIADYFHQWDIEAPDVDVPSLSGEPEGYGSGGDVGEYIPDSSVRKPTAQEWVLAEKLTSVFQDIMVDVSPGWIPDEPHGRINVLKAMQPVPDVSQMWESWDEGELDSQVDMIVCVDSSESMQSSIDEVMGQVWAVCHSVQNIDSTAVVLSYSDGEPVQWDVPHGQVLNLTCGGGTRFAKTWDKVVDIAHSKDNPMVVILTDGQWVDNYMVQPLINAAPFPVSIIDHDDIVGDMSAMVKKMFD